jgi:hypothetical protein
MDGGAGGGGFRGERAPARRSSAPGAWRSGAFFGERWG